MHSNRTVIASVRVQIIDVMVIIILDLVINIHFAPVHLQFFNRENTVGPYPATNIDISNMILCVSLLFINYTHLTVPCKEQSQLCIFSTIYAEFLQKFFQQNFYFILYVYTRETFG